MKKTVLLLIALFAASIAFCQQFKKPTDGKSLVYFVRFSGTGALINFKYFDGEEYLGKMSGVNYFTYECEPGEHIFWAAAENRDFLKGELLPNATYIVEVRPTMGALKAAVRLHQVAPDNERALKKVRKIIAKRSPSSLKGQEEDLTYFIENGLERLDKIEDQVKIINSSWKF